VEIPAVSKEVLFPFILAQEGFVKLLEPAELKTELKSLLQKSLRHLRPRRKKTPWSGFAPTR
jgi:hypothetical protein